MKPWTVISSKQLVNERWLQLSEQRVRLANGHEIERFFLIKSPDWASVLCLTGADEVVMVRQYRHGLSRPSLELPAGVIEPGEAPEQAARRELLEETGYESSDWRAIFDVAPEPARHTTRAHFFFARGASKTSGLSLDAAEELELVLVPRSELLRMCSDGSIEHGVHIAAILSAFARGLL